MTIRRISPCFLVVICFCLKYISKSIPSNWQATLVQRSLKHAQRTTYLPHVFCLAHTQPHLGELSSILLWDTIQWLYVRGLDNRTEPDHVCASRVLRYSQVFTA